MTVGTLRDSPPASGGDGEFLPLSALSDRGLVEELRRVRRLAARIEARSSELIGEAARRGIPAEEGFGSSTGWLMALTGDPAPVCRCRTAVARWLPSMPVTREAFASGELSEPRVRLLAAAREAAPESFARDERLLVGAACRLSSGAFPQALAHWRRLADPDGALRDADRAFEQRCLQVSATWAGMVRLDGDLDPESGAVVMTALSSLSDPWALEAGDRRSPQQRRADALVEICRRHLDSADRPKVGGERPHVVLTVDLPTLQGKGNGLANLGAGPITAEAARRLACDSSLTRLTRQDDSRQLQVGRHSRVVPAGLRRALNLRDQWCTHPGCDIPARWCDAHHRIHWADGGPTNLTNLQLLCRRHHRTAHDHAACPRRE